MRLKAPEVLSAEIMTKMGELGQLAEQALGEFLFSLVHNRTSQINGCAFCLDFDVKKAKLRGERELRLYHVAVWRESPLFSEKEKAALEFAEAVTKITPEGISDALWEKTKKHFSDKEIGELTFAVGLVNLFNRVNVTFRTSPGIYDTVAGLDKAGLK